MLLTKPLKQHGHLSGARGWAERDLQPFPKDNLPRGAHPREPERHGVGDKGDQSLPAQSRGTGLGRPERSKGLFPSFETISKAL